MGCTLRAHFDQNSGEQLDPLVIEYAELNQLVEFTAPQRAMRIPEERGQGSHLTKIACAAVFSPR